MSVAPPAPSSPQVRPRKLNPARLGNSSFWVGGKAPTLPNPPPLSHSTSQQRSWQSGSGQQPPARLWAGEAAGELGTANTAEHGAEQWEGDILTWTCSASSISSLCGHGGGYEQHCGLWIVKFNFSSCLNRNEVKLVSGGRAIGSLRLGEATGTSLPPSATSPKPENLLHRAGPSTKNPTVVLQKGKR